MADGTLYVDEQRHVSHVTRFDEKHAVVFHLHPGCTLITTELENTGNGFIACFPAVHSTQQDYYVCLDYSQARDLVLALAEFKQELGFVDNN